MDKGTIIIAIVFIAIVTIPFIISGFVKNRKQKVMRGLLNELADEHNCVITQYEYFNNFILGIDPMAYYLFFLRRKEDKFFKRSINLRKVQKCLLNNSDSNTKKRSEHYMTGSRIRLTFVPIEKNQPEEYIDLYNKEHDNLTLTGELQVAERWQEVINSTIQSIGG